MIDATTELYGVIGNPVRHSLSPIFHNRALRRMGRNALYLAFEVVDLEKALSGVRGLGIRGLSVTIPFKAEVIRLLDEVEEVSKKMKAVNTIVNRGGKLIGYNTDGWGAVAALEKVLSLEGKKAMILGAGGAARAIAYALKERGVEIIIGNRSIDRGRGLAEELNCGFKPLSSIEEVDGDLLVNATSVGMEPHGTETPLPRVPFKRGMTVMDIVYRPLQTRLLHDARRSGCRVIDGLQMLAYQGAKQLELWTGKRPEVAQIRRDLLWALRRLSR